MKWTWKDIKLAALQKMFAAEGNTIPNDDSVKDYVASMPQACNEALSILSRVGRYVKKSVMIAHNPIPNMLTGFQDKQLLTESLTASMENARSYSFDYSGTGTLKIYIDDLPAQEIELDSKEYTTKKGFLSGSKVVFVFTPTYPLTISNLAFYPVAFATVDDIPSYKDVIKYDLKELVPDFHRVDEIYCDGINTKYMSANIYGMEGDHILTLKSDKPGNYLVWYLSFPQLVTSATIDDYEFDLPDDFMLLVPMYIASEIYKEDDLAIATSYRNEFEVELQRLYDQMSQAPTEQKFTSESGWN